MTIVLSIKDHFSYIDDVDETDIGNSESTTQNMHVKKISRKQRREDKLFKKLQQCRINSGTN